MSSWLTQFTDHGSTARLGPLEWRVLEALWAHPGPRSVRELYPEFADLAYTTLTSTLDRLCQKGLLERSRESRAFQYRPRLTRPQFEAALAGDAVRSALSVDGSREKARSLLAFFVDALCERDPKLLDRLDAEVRARRAALDDEPG
jgi:predicted transcriptional regulator